MAISQKKLAYQNEYYNNINDYQKPVDNLKKEYFFSKLKNAFPDDSEIERKKNKILFFYLLLK